MSNIKKRPENKKNQTERNKKRSEYSEWRDKVYKNGNFICAVTGIKPQRLNAHHLFSKKVFSSIELDPENGVVLSTEIHEFFHSYFGTLNIITIDHFIDFLELLIVDKNSFRENVLKKVIPRKDSYSYVKIISNQLSNKKDTGSETILRSNYLLQC